MENTRPSEQWKKLNKIMKLKKSWHDAAYLLFAICKCGEKNNSTASILNAAGSTLIQCVNELDSILHSEDTNIDEATEKQES